MNNENKIYFDGVNDNDNKTLATFQLGIENLLYSKDLMDYLKSKKVSLVAHPASVTQNLDHSLDALFNHGVSVASCYGPQHGMRGEKQDNMMESEDYLDPVHDIPVHSLYGKSRHPSDESMKKFDVCLFDLQDVGTRIYTFLTTLLYMMQACHKFKKELWVLDRPNPAGRAVEGLTLQKGWESFVGAASIPMRHGMTLGEMALWFKKNFHFDFELKIIPMKNYHLFSPWPQGLSWVNPSPNAPNISMARCFPGTVLLEGTHLSEGRGTTRPLEVLGAPGLDAEKIIKQMHSLSPDWLKGCRIRACYFEPTFHKHQKNLCSAIQIHVDGNFYDEKLFKPFRLVSLAFKVIKELYPDFILWRDFPYEYVFDKLAIDVINGGPFLREWVDDKSATPQEFEKICTRDEQSWLESRKSSLIYST